MIHVTRTARWFKYSVMEGLNRRVIRRGVSGPRGLERPLVVERQLKVYPVEVLRLKISSAQRFVRCSIVGCEPQISREQERRVRLRDCERYLQHDSRFWYVTDQVRSFGPGAERTKIIDEFWKTAYGDYYLSERDLIRARGRVLSEYIALLDEEYDRSGLECERSYGPGHVEDGGGDARQSGNSSHLKCERSYGPSHVEEGGGDALQVDQVDRSSPVQSQRSRAL
jgi:hypothetical protein